MDIHDPHRIALLVVRRRAEESKPGTDTEQKHRQNAEHGNDTPGQTVKTLGIGKIGQHDR